MWVRGLYWSRNLMGSGGESFIYNSGHILSIPPNTDPSPNTVFD